MVADCAVLLISLLTVTSPQRKPPCRTAVNRSCLAIRVSLPSRLDLPVAVLTFPRLSVVICLRGLLDDIYPVKSARQNLPGKIYQATSIRRYSETVIRTVLCLPSFCRRGPTIPGNGPVPGEPLTC